MHGFSIAFLAVDLSSGPLSSKRSPTRFCGSVLAARDWPARLLLERNPAGVDPLAPENHLIFATGPFCGGRLWGGSRFGVLQVAFDRLLCRILLRRKSP